MGARKREGTRRRKRGRVFIVLGIILLVGAASLTAYNMWDSARAGRSSSEIAQQLEADGGTAQGDADGMAVKTVDGHRCIGVLSIPSSNIELPVIADWDYPSLRIAPCRYSGSYLADDLVICGHNYASHFGPLQNIAIGTDVYFTTADGQAIHYIVGNRETLQPTDVAQMIENDHNSDSAADWDMTLFTCDYTGQARCAVRCIRQ